MVNDIVKISWSGGKDSTAAGLLHLEKGHKCKIVCYVPMFDKETPLILKDHYEFIMRMKKRFELLGAEVYIIHGISFWDYCTKVTTRGKYKGLIFGFPIVGAGLCGFKRDSKVKALNSFDCGYYDYQDIGIAADETQRHNQLNDKLRSILVELGYTETHAKNLCIVNECLSPKYLMGDSNRDGCVVCCNAKESEREQWYKDYPGAKEKLFELNTICKIERPDRAPLRGYKWFF